MPNARCESLMFEYFTSSEAAMERVDRLYILGYTVSSTILGHQYVVFYEADRSVCHLSEVDYPVLSQ